MRRRKVLITALLVAGLLTGCRTRQPETEAMTEAPTELQTEAVTEVMTEAQTEPQTEAPEDSMNKTRVLKGLVKTSDTATLTIQTERGKELQFNITGADIQLTSGLQTGATVNILYKGTIEDTDTSNAKVQMIRELDAGDTPVTEGELMTESAEADPNAGAGVLTGSIADVNADRIVILADDGDSFYFSLYETNISLKNGLQKNNYVTVSYTGDIYGPDLVPANVIADTEKEAERPKAGPSAAGEFSYVNGTIDDITTGTVTITSDDGEQLTFDTVGARQCFEEGIAAGSYITVEYTGSMDGAETSGVQVTAVYNYTENAPAAQSAEAPAEEDTVSEKPETEKDADAATDEVILDGSAEEEEAA
ncbi:MAG: hypothetical protein Q4B57_06190 [Eubacteriales bacterium]|nr:hypothetical protein [Eubacteriales bacterium]